MTAQRWLTGLAVALIACGTLSAEEAALPADAVRLTSAQKANGPEAFEWLYTFDCQAGRASPSLRVSLGQMAEYSASAGVSLPVDDQDRALGSVRVRIALLDKAAGTYTLTAEIGPGGPSMIGRTLRLDAGKELASVVDLRPLPATGGFRHALVLGSVGGCSITVYLMPGRSPARPDQAEAKPAGDPAVESAALFRRWVQGVKTGDAEQFAAGVSPSEWSRLSTEQRSQRLKESKDSFTTVLGADFNPDLFKVEYAGGPVGGKLKVRYGDKELPDLNVRAHNGVWILSEP